MNRKTLWSLLLVWATMALAIGAYGASDPLAGGDEALKMLKTQAASRNVWANQPAELHQAIAKEAYVVAINRSGIDTTMQRAYLVVSFYKENATLVMDGQRSYLVALYFNLPLTSTSKPVVGNELDLLRYGSGVVLAPEIPPSALEDGIESGSFTKLAKETPELPLSVLSMLGSTIYGILVYLRGLTLKPCGNE